MSAEAQPTGDAKVVVTYVGAWPSKVVEVAAGAAEVLPSGPLKTGVCVASVRPSVGPALFVVIEHLSASASSTRVSIS